jgi:Fic family protein
MRTPDSVSSALQELIDNVDEELQDYQSLGEFDEGIQERLRLAFWPERISDTLNIEGIHVNPRITMAVLEGLALADVDKYAEREINNIVDAHNLIDEVVNSGQEIEPGLVKQLSFRVNQDLIDTAGQYRTRDVAISGAQVTPPAWQDVPHRMAELCAGLSDAAGAHPIVKAAWLHREFAEIHPFDDGNGRTARLLQDMVMAKAGYLPVGIPAFRRREYYDALEQGDFGDLEPLIAMIANSEQTALSKASRVVRRVPDRQRAVQGILRGRKAAKDRREEHRFHAWRSQVEQVRQELEGWVGSFRAEAATSVVRLKSWDPMTIETWREVRSRGWARNSWLFTVFMGAPGDRGCSVLFAARRIDKIAGLQDFTSSEDVDPLAIQVLVSGENGRYDFNHQDDRYVTLRGLAFGRDGGIAAYKASDEGAIEAERTTDYAVFEEFFQQLAVKSGWVI